LRNIFARYVYDTENGSKDSKRQAVKESKKHGITKQIKQLIRIYSPHKGFNFDAERSVEYILILSEGEPKFIPLYTFYHTRTGGINITDVSAAPLETGVSIPLDDPARIEGFISAGIWYSALFSGQRWSVKGDDSFTGVVIHAYTDVYNRNFDYIYPNASENLFFSLSRWEKECCGSLGPFGAEGTVDTINTIVFESEIPSGDGISSGVGNGVPIILNVNPPYTEKELLKAAEVCLEIRSRVDEGRLSIHFVGPRWSDADFYRTLNGIPSVTRVFGKGALESLSTSSRTREIRGVKWVKFIF